MKMPNYCMSYVRFENLNEAAKEKYNLLQQRLTSEKNFSDLMNDGSVSEEEIHTRSWQHDHVGPKWTTIDDIDDEGMSLTSAWSAPTDGVEWLIRELSSVQPDLITVYSYQEEQPDFAGIYVYEGEDMYDGYEDDFDDIRWVLEQKVDGLVDMKDEDGDYTEEGWDLFHENVWEVLNDTQDEFLVAVMENLKENKEESENE